MLTDAPSQTYHSNARPVDDLSYMNVPVIHIKAQCGYLAGYGDTEYIDTLPTMPVIVDKTYHGNTAYLKQKVTVWMTTAGLPSAMVTRF